MKERPDSSFAHPLFVQAAVSAKNYSQASSERRGGSVKDELTLRTCQQGNAVRRMGEFPSGTIPISFICSTKLSFYWYLQAKQRHWTSRTFPVVTLSSSFSLSFFFRMFVLVSRHDRLCTFEQRTVSFCACHHERISPRLTSLD